MEYQTDRNDSLTYEKPKRPVDKLSTGRSGL